MVWKSVGHRSDVLRAVTSEANARRDGHLPMYVDGVSETFRDEVTLLDALTLRWRTRLERRIETELATQPVDLERAVVRAWQATARELPGVLQILDHHRNEPLDDAMAAALATTTRREHVLLAAAAGQGFGSDSVRAGARIAELARTSGPVAASNSLVDRLRAVLHAA